MVKIIRKSKKERELEERVKEFVEVSKAILKEEGYKNFSCYPSSDYFGIHLKKHHRGLIVVNIKLKKVISPSEEYEEISLKLAGAYENYDKEKGYSKKEWNLEGKYKT